MAEHELLIFLSKIQRFSQFGDLTKYTVVKEGPALFTTVLSISISNKEKLICVISPERSPKID